MRGVFDKSEIKSQPQINGEPIFLRHRTKMIKIFIFRVTDRIMQPQILLLKDGTESAGGKQQVISNINACQAIVDAVRTTLGPRGMDKLIVDPRVRTATSMF